MQIILQIFQPLQINRWGALNEFAGKGSRRETSDSRIQRVGADNA